MKLKNKKTGEIIEVKSVDLYEGYGIKLSAESLAELNSEWEDYEEPKGNWTIDPINEDCIDDGRYTTPDELERYEELGLKFNTREEAELAVRKLKAWQRLKDLDTEILGWEIRDMPTGGDWQTVNVKLNIKARKEPMELLDLLFSGGEDE